MALAFPVPVPARTPAARPELRLVEGGRSAGLPVGSRPSEATYRRRRLVAAVAAALVVAASGSLLSSLVGGAVATPPDGTYLVAAGQSLWEVAGELSPGANRLEVVSLLAEANGDTTVVQAGQRLLVPGEVLTLGG